MVLTPSAFTHEHLSNLKFKELQKLSVQFRVNKRWAKKQELIENLLALKPKDHLKNDECKELDQWKDGSVVFQDHNQAEKENNTTDRRFTFNVDKSGVIDSRLTFSIPPKKLSLLLEKDETKMYSRETYEIPQKKGAFSLEPIKESRATYEIPHKEPLLPEKENDSRATYDIPQNDSKIMLTVQKELKMSENQDDKKAEEKECSKHDSVKNSSMLVKHVRTSNCSIFSTENKSITDSTKKSCVKMLTIPYARVPKRNRKDVEDGKPNSSIIKLSQKSINIKKTKLPTKLDGIKSPVSLRKPISGPQNVSSLRAQAKNSSPSKIPTVLPFMDKTISKPEPVDKPKDNNKENLNKTVARRKSKTADEVLIKKVNVAKVSFMSPPVSLNRKNSAHLPINKTPITRENKELIKKPVTAKKMPDFNKIHQKQFEQMDSLPEYLRKKEERTRKLFGTPLQTSQQKMSSNSNLFKFQSSVAVNLETKFGKSSENIKNSKGTAQKETVKSRLPPTKLQTDTKNKTRNHIIGVRTNKRFELQMKLRNM